MCGNLKVFSHDSKKVSFKAKYLVGTQKIYINYVKLITFTINLENPNFYGDILYLHEKKGYFAKGKETVVTDS